MPDLIRFSDLKDSQPLTLNGNNDLFAIAVKNDSSETGYTSMTVKPNMIAGYVAEDATYVNLKTGASDNTVVKAINKTLENFADEFNTTAGSTYAKDECVIYDGVLYQCSNPTGTTSGTFVTADWTQVRAVDVGTGGGGGSSGDHITLTQAEYDALVQAGTVDPNAFYFISDATFPSYAHNYSTEEQIVGTWVDGSPVYEKTIQATPTTGDYAIDISALNIDVVVDLWGTSKQSISAGRYHCIKVPYCYDANDRALVYYQTDTGYLKLVGSSANINNEWHITIRYTKSSS